jgi:hypothetical protein
LICPNCGRRNSSGATFCSRCRQRLPLATKLNGGHRRTVVVEPRGGGGSGAVVLAVALLAGFLFIGGAAAIYLSNPPGTADPTHIAVASGSPTLPPFVQPTATPSPSPTFIILPSESPSFSPFPSSSIVGPTPPPTPVGPSSPPTPVPVVAKFTCSQQGTSTILKCQENSTGNVTGWQWDFGDGATSSERNPQPHDYGEYGQQTVTLIVTSPTGATDSRTREFTLKPPPTPSPTPGETATPSPSQAPTTNIPTIVVPEATATPSPEPTGSSAP